MIGKKKKKKHVRLTHTNMLRIDDQLQKFKTKVWWWWLGVALHVSQGDHKTTLTCQKIFIYTKLTYFDHPNKSINHLDLRITRI